jgi:hypothetical protein
MKGGEKMNKKMQKLLLSTSAMLYSLLSGIKSYAEPINPIESAINDSSSSSPINHSLNSSPFDVLGMVANLLGIVSLIAIPVVIITFLVKLLSTQDKKVFFKTKILKYILITATLVVFYIALFYARTIIFFYNPIM